MKKEFIEVLEKYFFDFNTYDVREKLRNKIRNLLTKDFLVG
jgi:hypothetical protein